MLQLARQWWWIFFPFGLKFLTISLVVMFAKQCEKIASWVFKTRVSWSNSSLQCSSSWVGKQKLSTWNPRRTRVPPLHFFFLICFCRVFLLCFSILLLCFSVLHSPLQIFVQIILRSLDLCFPIEIVLHSLDLHFPVQIVLYSPLQIYVFLLRIYVF